MRCSRCIGRERAEGHEFDFGFGGLLRPLAATCSGGLLRPLAATCSDSVRRPLAATCGHSSGCKWLQVAAAEKRMLAGSGGHWRPLEWLQVAASGCRLEENSGGHWRPLSATWSSCELNAKLFIEANASKWIYGCNDRVGKQL